MIYIWLIISDICSWGLLVIFANARMIICIIKKIRFIMLPFFVAYTLL